MTDQIKVLVIDDEAGIREMLMYELSHRGYHVTTASDGEEALAAVRQEHFSVAVSDMMMPKMDGLALLVEFKKADPDMEVILITGFATIDNAVEGMKRGAYDFLPKPFDLDRLDTTIRKAISQNDLKALVGVYESSKAVFASMDQNRIVPVVLEQTKKILRADSAAFISSDAQGALRVSAVSPGMDLSCHAGLLKVIESSRETLFKAKVPLIVSKEKPEGCLAQSGFNLCQGCCLALFPLVTGDQNLGVLVAIRLEQGKYAFSSADLRYGTILGSQISQALSNANLMGRLEEKVIELQNANQKLEETQQQLIQSEKLAAIGQLAAGVAHELNNPLTGILGFSQLLLEKNGLSKEDREDLEGIHTESRRCRQIIQNLLKFSRRNEPRMEPVSIAAILKQTLDLVRYDIVTSGVDIVQEIQDDACDIFGDPSQIQQVFINVLNNAQQAMENQEKPRLIIQLWSEGKHTFIRFSDNGCGIEPSNLNRIFDPFFTTKPVGKGTGLGLSVSYGIIEAHKGTISVESEVGKGTKMTILFPIYERESRKAVAHLVG